MAKHMGERFTPHAAISELANRAANRSIAMVGPVIEDRELGIGFLLVLAGGSGPMKTWVEVGGSSVEQLAECGDTIRRIFDTVENFTTNLALAEAALARWPLSATAAAFVTDERECSR